MVKTTSNTKIVKDLVVPPPETRVIVMASNTTTHPAFKAPETVKRVAHLPEHHQVNVTHSTAVGDAVDSESGNSKDHLDDEEVPEEFELGEDVYSLIFISPICSPSFVFASYMIALKLVLFTFLAVDLYSRSNGDFDDKTSLIRATQFFLLPVAIAMQSDLIHVYTRIANIRYDPSVMQVSPAATETKFALSFLLRFIDGLYSLIINFVLLLITDDVLSTFLNFAALGFLQSIDDVAFHLAAEGSCKGQDGDAMQMNFPPINYPSHSSTYLHRFLRTGFLGDRMERNCQIVKSTSLPRRVGDCLTNALDSVLFMTTYLVMLTIYVYVIVSE